MSPLRTEEPCQCARRGEGRGGEGKAGTDAEVFVKEGVIALSARRVSSVRFYSSSSSSFSSSFTYSLNKITKHITRYMDTNAPACV